MFKVSYNYEIDNELRGKYVDTMWIGVYHGHRVTLLNNRIAFSHSPISYWDPIIRFVYINTVVYWLKLRTPVELPYWVKERRREYENRQTSKTSSSVEENIERT